MDSSLSISQYHNKNYLLKKENFDIFRNNTVSTVMGDHSMEIRAKTRIRAGEEITNQYMAPDTPTYLR